MEVVIESASADRREETSGSEYAEFVTNGLGAANMKRQCTASVKNEICTRVRLIVGRLRLNKSHVDIGGAVDSVLVDGVVF